MGTPAVGKIGIRLESLSAQGEQLLLPPTPIAPTLSLTTQPAQPQRLRIYVWGNTATGTVTLTGTTIGGGAATETIPPTGSIPINTLQLQAPLADDYEFVSNNIYTSITASSVTTTGLTGGVIRIGGIVASNFALPAVMESDLKMEQISFNESRGLLDLHTRIIEGHHQAEIGKLDMLLYPDDCLWMPYMAVSSAPVITTLPAAPTVLKTSTTLSASPTTIPTITAPTAPGMLLQFVLTGIVTAGSIAITGTSALTNASVTETILLAVGQTVAMSTNVYSAITSSQVIVTGPTAGTVTVNGIFANQFAFTSDNLNLYTAALEWFTGTDSRIYPFSFMDEMTLQGGANKDHQLNCKLTAADMPAIGDRTTAPLLTPRITSLPQPLDWAEAGWQTQAYIDPLGGTPLTTPYNDLLDWKIVFKPGNTPVYTATQSPVYNRVYRKKREVLFDGTIDFTNLAEYENFRLINKRYIGLDMQGPFIGIAGGVPIYKRWQIILALKYQTFKEEAGPDKEKVEAKITGRCEYDPTLGYSHKLICINQQSSTYATP